ncbi:MAG: aminodeoxychorismate/anthranilate synthase component II [Planctomycetota bacterium]
MILVLDNYDSFVHNLARLLSVAGAETRVVRSDAITATEVADLAPDGMVVSPGPGAPEDAGCSIEAVRAIESTTPVLGVCLGHQAIIAAFGGVVTRAPEPRHGRTSTITHDGIGLFDGAPNPMTVCRYHSLAADEARLPEELRVTATADDGVVMAIAHRTRPVCGVQFHPEAILTEAGDRLLANFVRRVRGRSV